MAWIRNSCLLNRTLPSLLPLLLSTTAIKTSLLPSTPPVLIVHNPSAHGPDQIANAAQSPLLPEPKSYFPLFCLQLLRTLICLFLSPKGLTGLSMLNKPRPCMMLTCMSARTKISFSTLTPTMTSSYLTLLKTIPWAHSHSKLVTYFMALTSFVFIILWYQAIYIICLIYFLKCQPYGTSAMS